MLHFPSVMKKAQDELDHVVGLNRMPEFDDKDNLPYVKAVINETLRFIPKGSTIFANFSSVFNFFSVSHAAN
ncbi:hypothetical protein C0989_005101 [Termitomyces sp. Mn162]|nr:hypothetical protein C0989_005101 [Termitomyces sp. Mn162]